MGRGEARSLCAGAGRGDARGVMAGPHISRVRALYRRLLQLHRVLPPDLKALGDQYVKDEFRRHKAVGAAEAQRFLQEWEASDPELRGGSLLVSRVALLRARLSRAGWRGARHAIASQVTPTF